MGYLSKNKSVKCPVSKYIQFKGGKFSYYDKETKEQIEVKTPIKFISIDSMTGIGGGQMDGKKAFHPVSSNIVAHLGKELVARVDGEEFVRGTWKEIKDTVKGKGGRYVSYEFALMNKELVCFKLVGSSLAAWFNKEGAGDFITCEKTKKETTGTNTYEVPIFVTEKLTEKQIKELEESPEVDKFKEYQSSKLEKGVTEEEEEGTPIDDALDEM